MVDDQEIWDSAETPETVEAPQVEVAEPTPEVARDEQGRFAPKQEAEPEPQAEPVAEPKDESRGIPSWRLKEEAEARRQAKDEADRYRRELDDMRRQLQSIQQQNAPKPEVPDIFENPAGFVDHRNQEAISPIKSEISQLREHYSQQNAIRDHGAEKVQAAYDALGQSLNSRDPEAAAVYQRAMSSIDPYGDIMKWHQRQTTFQRVGNDPVAYAKREALELAKSDPDFQAQLLAIVRGVAQGRPSIVTPLPPSLNRATSAAPPGNDGDDESDAGLLKSALRR